MNDFAAWIQTIASLCGILLAFIGIRIAASTARDQRNNRNFNGDKDYAVAFDHAIGGDGAKARLLVAPRERSAAAFGELNLAWNTYTRGVSNADIALQIYFSQCEREMQAAYNVMSEEKDQTELNLVFDANIERMRSAARDWVYPERRAEVLERAYSFRIDRGGVQTPYPKSLQLKRWLIAGDPSPVRAWQWCRVKCIQGRMLAYDLTHGRVQYRWIEWRTTRRLAKTGG